MHSTTFFHFNVYFHAENGHFGATPIMLSYPLTWVPKSSHVKLRHHWYVESTKS